MIHRYIVNSIWSLIEYISVVLWMFTYSLHKKIKNTDKKNLNRCACVNNLVLQFPNMIMF